MMADFPEEQLWNRPAGVASPAFHLQHLSGVLSRLFTYARGESLSPAQREALKAEDAPSRPGRHGGGARRRVSVSRSI